MRLNKLYDVLEDENHHGPCAIVAAIAGRDAPAVRRLVEIVQEHTRVGHMTSELCQERYALAKDYYKLLANGGTVASVAAENEHFGRLLSAIEGQDYDEIIRIGLEG